MATQQSTAGQAINQQIQSLLAQLKHEGLLDDQFSQLMALQDESNPDFVAEVGIPKSPADDHMQLGLFVCILYKSVHENTTSLQLVQLYFVDSAQKLERLDQKLQAPVPDFHEIDQLVHQFKGSSASFGAQAIAQLCVSLREMCQQQNAAGCRACLEKTKETFAQLKSKLEVFMQLETQRKSIESMDAQHG